MIKRLIVALALSILMAGSLSAHGPSDIYLEDAPQCFVLADCERMLAEYGFWAWLQCGCAFMG